MRTLGDYQRAVEYQERAARLNQEIGNKQECRPTNKSVDQPRSQVLSPTRRETLVGSGHVSRRIWDITNKQFGGGADKCEICLYKA